MECTFGSGGLFLGLPWWADGPGFLLDDRFVMKGEL